MELLRRLCFDFHRLIKLSAFKTGIQSSLTESVSVFLRTIVINDATISIFVEQGVCSTVYFILIVYDCFACVCAHIPHVCLVPKEAR